MSPMSVETVAVFLKNKEIFKMKRQIHPCKDWRVFYQWEHSSYPFEWSKWIISAEMKIISEVHPFCKHFQHIHAVTIATELFLHTFRKKKSINYIIFKPIIQWQVLALLVCGDMIIDNNRQYVDVLDTLY